MNHSRLLCRRALSLAVGLLLSCGLTSLAAGLEANRVDFSSSGKPLEDVLPPGEWREVEVAVDRALAWISTQQAADGSFPTLPQAQPAVTSFCVMAFLSRGHQPGRGPYGRQLEKAIDFVLSCQMTNGLFSYLTPQSELRLRGPSHTGAYNHAISGLMLGEVFGAVSGERAKKVRKALGAALEFTLQAQAQPKRFPADKGGWRYLRPTKPGTGDADLSVTGWQIMFLRSARNAEFQVPASAVEDALGFVRRCWDPDKGLFYYVLEGETEVSTRGMMGAGILSLCLGGRHDDPIGLAAGNWLLAHPYQQFGQVIGRTQEGRLRDRYYYSCYYCSQAMAQLGGRYWKEFFPPMTHALLSGQMGDGSWPPENGRDEIIWGNLLSTSLAVLSLTPPYQLLPVYQR